MTAQEAHKEQWNKLKDKPLSDKLKYIFTYYWPGILGAALAIILAVTWVTNILNQKEAVLSGYMLNSTSNTSYAGDFVQEFMDFRGINGETHSVNLTSDIMLSVSEYSDSSLAVMESVTVRIVTGELDFVIADLNTYPILSAYFADPKTLLTAEQQEKWKDNFVYVEKASLDKLKSDDVDTIEIPEYHLSTEDLTDPVAMGIRIPATSPLMDAYFFPEGEVIFGITQSVQNIENTLAFLEYIME